MRDIYYLLLLVFYTSVYASSDIIEPSFGLEAYRKDHSSLYTGCGPRISGRGAREWSGLRPTGGEEGRVGQKRPVRQSSATSFLTGNS